MVKDLFGKTIKEIEKSVSKVLKMDHLSYDFIIFTTDKGEKYKLHHKQDCCEEVFIEDIVGDLDDLLNTPILMAEKVTSKKHPPDESKKYKENYGDNYMPITSTSEDSITWTFYKFATIKGSVTIRWYGTSNGYYSEEVDFEKI